MSSIIPPDYSHERRRVDAARAELAEAGADACKRALHSVGIHVDDRLYDALYQAIEENAQ